MFGGGGGEQTGLWENAAEKGICLVLGILHKVHYMTTCTEFEG